MSEDADIVLPGSLQEEDEGVVATTESRVMPYDDGKGFSQTWLPPLRHHHYRAKTLTKANPQKSHALRIDELVAG